MWSKCLCSLKANSEMVIYDLAHVLMGLIDKFVLLAHKQTQLVPVLKLGLYILTGTQKMKKKNHTCQT